MRKLTCHILLSQLLLFANPVEFEKVRRNYEEVAKSLKKKVWRVTFRDQVA